LKKIAVTGASGHVGNVLCRELVRRGFQVKALVHENMDDLEAIGVEIIRGDILKGADLEKLVKDCGIVYHLAAKISIDKKDKNIVYKTNVQGTQNVLDACVQGPIKKMVHFSTIHTFGIPSPEEPLDETRPLIKRSPFHYENSKAEAERRVLDAAGDKLETVVLNPTAIFGPYDYQPSLLGQALIKMYLNQLPMLVPGGYDFVDVRDVVDGAIQAMEKGRSGERYILSGTWKSLKDLSGLIHQITGKKTPRMVVPSVVAKIGLPFIQAHAQITRSHPLYTSESLAILKESPRNINTQKAKNELAYQPRSLEQSLKDTFEWFEENKMI
jgi:dihydroflavonol-4-reductase